MRLLYYRDDGQLALTRDLARDIPPYAILSHTWGPDDEEVTFQDIVNGHGSQKSGFEKIAFCGRRAAADGLDHFWVDTCCIQKSDSTELTRAINSMFRWYQESARCYVYLSGLSLGCCNGSSRLLQFTGETALRQHRWFTRGWTLQELVAPKSVDFFCSGGHNLGSKATMGYVLSDITGIPENVLRGLELSSCTVEERFAWADRRQTTHEEDRAYSLLGIFGVQMPIIPGEGLSNATRRLREEIDRASKGTYHESFTVPFSLTGAPEAGHFVARQQELADIHQALRSDGTRRVVVLHGLGGIGKTQLAIEYAKRYRENYSAVFWLSIKDAESVSASFHRMAEHIHSQHPSAITLFDGPLRSAGGLAKKRANNALSAVNNWLSRSNNTRWLLIFDNYDNPRRRGNNDPAAVDINEFLPASYQGSVIVTTRVSDLQMGQNIAVQKIERVDENLEILSCFSGRANLAHDPDALELIRQLDGLPLAIATAGAYLNQTPISCAIYLRLYKDSWSTLQKNSPELTAYEDRTLYSTWDMSFRQIQAQCVPAAELLRLWAYLDNEDVWFELLHDVLPTRPEWLRDMVFDEIAFYATMRILCSYGLVEQRRDTPNAESPGFGIHACVHAWSKHVLNQPPSSVLRRLSMELVANHGSESYDSASWSISRRLEAHAVRCAEIIPNHDFQNLPNSWVLQTIATLVSEIEFDPRLDLAELIYKQALQHAEKTTGPDNLETMNVLNTFCGFLLSIEKLEEAEAGLRKVLIVYEKHYDPNDEITLRAVQNLGQVLLEQGRYDKAVEMLTWAMEGHELDCGPNDPRTLDVIGLLGITYRRMGKFEEARNLNQREFSGFQEIWGMNHPSTLLAASDLGRAYEASEMWDLAEEMYTTVLHGREKILGSGHPDTVAATQAFGDLCLSRKRFDEAERYYKQVLRRLDALQGRDDELAMMAATNLGIVYREQGKLELAEQMATRALDYYQNHRDSKHDPDILDSLDNLGMVYMAKGELESAERMFDQAFQGYERLSNNAEDSANAIEIMYNLGTLYAREGKIDKAKDILGRSLEGYKKVRGPMHEQTRQIEQLLASLHADVGLNSTAIGQTLTETTVAEPSTDGDVAEHGVAKQRFRLRSLKSVVGKVLPKKTGTTQW